MSCSDGETPLSRHSTALKLPDKRELSRALHIAALDNKTIEALDNKTTAALDKGPIAPLAAQNISLLARNRPQQECPLPQETTPAIEIQKLKEEEV